MVPSRARTDEYVIDTRVFRRIIGRINGTGNVRRGGGSFVSVNRAACKLDVAAENVDVRVRLNRTVHSGPLADQQTARSRFGKRLRRHEKYSRGPYYDETNHPPVVTGRIRYAGKEGGAYFYENRRRYGGHNTTRVFVSPRNRDPARTGIYERTLSKTVCPVHQVIVVYIVCAGIGRCPAVRP